jgi:hypothetical protein
VRGPEPRGSDDEEQARTEALDILQDVLEWTTSPDHWRLIARLVDAMADAVVRHDLDALDACTADLELESPLRRVIRIGEGEAEPPPAPLRDRVNRLIHSLEPSAPKTKAVPSGEPADRPGSGRLEP